jgi:hypothetical protein
MPKDSKRASFIRDLQDYIEYKHEHIKHNLKHNLYTSAQEEKERIGFKRIETLYQAVVQERYYSRRIYRMVDHSTLNFLLHDISDRNFKQQFRIERFNFEMIASRIRGDSVKVLFITDI